MIRFACPGCSATFTVDDEKAGKTGKCPKCQTQFVIPAADAGAVPSPPADPPRAPAGESVEIDPCPKCRTRLSVSAGDVGLDVECPYCKTVFRATKSSAPPPAPPKPPALEPAGAGKSRSKRFADDEDDDRPSRRRRRDDDDDDDDDDDEDVRPSRRRRRRHREESKKIAAGVLALLLGGWGIHKFYLGYTTAGIIQIVLTFATCGIAGVIPLAEGIIYLTKSDDEFIETYQENERQWF